MSAATRDLKIGYSTLKDDLTAPGDRRRFCHFAERRAMSYEIAVVGRRYDVVVVSPGSDLGVWSQLPRETKLVFDLVDSYLAEPGTDPKAMLRGAAKFALGQTKRLHLDYRKVIEATCRRADAVVCGTDEQREAIRPLCPNVHLILDFQTEVVRAVKTDYARRDVFNLVWEGMSVNLGTFEWLAPTLHELSKRHSMALHLVTDLERATGSRNIWMRPTRDWVRRVFGDQRVYLYQWNREMLSTICTACDLAIIPIPLELPFMAGKPENKLVLFWRLGLPVLTSSTPAYVRAMKAAGVDMTCTTAADWSRQLERVMFDEDARRTAAERGRAHAEAAYSEAALLQSWDRVFESILETRGTEGA